jgi:hypothetical protein
MIGPGGSFPRAMIEGSIGPGNPYTQDVVNATQAEFNNQNQQQAQFLALDAARLFCPPPRRLPSPARGQPRSSGQGARKGMR